MHIPDANPMAGYPQPYATWAAVRAIADVQGGTSRADEPARSSEEDAAPHPYHVDVAA